MINWLSNTFSRNFVKKSDFESLERKVKTLEKCIEQIETVSVKQSELLAALAGIQSDLVLTVGDTLSRGDRDNLVVQKFILTAPDDDDLIN